MDNAAVFKTLLETAGVDINGWGVYVGKEPDSPHRAITLFNSGGLLPSPKWALDYPTVQLRVRGFPNSYQESRAKAQECRDALLGIDPQDVNNGQDRLVSVVVRSDIVDLGFDSTNRPIHSVNFNLITQPKAVGYRRELPPIAAPAPPADTLPLDLVPGCVFAISTRRLTSLYAGGCNVIRRESDNTQLGIGFDADGNYDTAAADNFRGGSQGFAVAWADQTSTGSSALVNTDQPTQPYFDKPTGIYGTRWSAGSAQILTAPDHSSIQDIFNGGGYALFVVDALMTAGTHSIVDKEHWAWYFFDAQLWIIRDGASGQGYWGTSNTVSPGLHIVELEYNDDVNNNVPTFRVDGNVLAVATSNPYGGSRQTDVGRDLHIGNTPVLVGGRAAIDGVIKEGYLYPMILDPQDRATLFNNVKAYWNSP